MIRLRRARGSTLAEVLFTVGLTVSVMTLGTLMYSHVASQTGDAVATLDASAGADRVARELHFLISNATSAAVTTVDGRTALKLIMPANAGASNVNGLVDSYAPSCLHPRGGTVTLPGQRVWVTASTFALIGAPSDVPLLARRADDATPTAADVDWSWAYRDGATKRVRRAMGAFTFTFSVLNDVVTWTIVVRVGDGAHGTALDGTNPGTYREMTIGGATLLRQAKPQ